jgi:hypothetical protein
MNYVWLVVVAGGAALLGLTLGLGMMKQDPRRTTFALLGAVAFAIVAVVAGTYVSSFSTAPIQAADKEHSEEKLPAGPAHSEELPGK